MFTLLAQRFASAAPRQQTLLLGLGVALISVVFGFGISAFGNPLLIAAIPFGLLFVWCVVNWPEAVAVFLLSYRWSYIPDALERVDRINSPIPAITGLLVLVILIRRFSGTRTPLVSDRIFWWVGGYILVVSLGLWYAQIPSLVSVRLNEIGNDMLICLTVMNLITTKQSLVRTFYLIMGVTAFLATLTVYQEVTKTYDNEIYGLARTKLAEIAAGVENRVRAGGPMKEPIVYGQMLLISVPLGIWAATHGRSLRARIFGMYVVAMCVSGVGLTFTRAVYISLLLALGLYALYVKLSPRYLVLLPLLLMLWQFAPAEIHARFDTLDSLTDTSGAAGTGINSDSSFQGRFSYLVLGSQMFVDHPLLGVGADHFRVYFQIYSREFGAALRDQERNAHNLYLEVITEHGIIGLSIFVSFLAMAGRRYLEAFRFFRAQGDSYMANLAAIALISYAGFLFSSFFYHGDYPRYFWLEVTIAIVFAHIARKERDAAIVEQARTQGAAVPALQGSL